MPDANKPASAASRCGGFERLCRVATWLDHALGWVSRVAAVLGAVVLVIISLMVSVSVMARNLFGIGLFDAVTPGRMAVTLAVFLGIAWALRRGDHVSVDLVVERLPYRWRHIVGAVAMSIALMAMCLLIWQTAAYALSALQMDEKIVGDIEWPAFPFQAVIPAGLTLFALELLRQIVRSTRFAIEGRPPPDAPQQRETREWT